MPKIRELSRTSVFAWGHNPSTSLPSIATGTASGAIDESFSNESKLEIWDVYDEDSLNGSVVIEEKDRKPAGSISVAAKFNNLAWSSTPTSSLPRGVLAGGLESGLLSLYDPTKILAGSSAADSTIFSTTKHKGPVRGLDFNHGKKQLLASGSSDGEIFIWDVSTISSSSTHYTPGTQTQKKGDITSLAWNNQVEHILASSLSSGYTLIWDLRKKAEIMSLSLGGNPSSGGAAGQRAAMSSICWHPDNATRIITASEDDSNPIIMLWDLRNSLAPEKIFTGHDKGVLSVSWCKQDPDLLLSCGKDNRTVLWNPQSSEILGEFPQSDNWAFQTAWNPRNPEILATASFDGKINIRTLQSTHSDAGAPSATAIAPVTTRADGADLFDLPNLSQVTRASDEVGFDLKIPPKWVRRPCTASFAFGGNLVSVNNLPSASGTNQSRSVHIRKVVTESSIVSRAEKLQQAAVSREELGKFCEERTAEGAGEESSEIAGWKALLTLFNTNSRNELVTLLGFSKEEVASQVSLAIKNFKSINIPGSEDPTPDGADSTETVTQHPPVVTFAPDPEAGDSGDSASGVVEATPSEVSASGQSDVTKKTEAESETTEPPSLFSDDGGAPPTEPGTPQVDAGADFFSTIGSLRSALPDHVRVPRDDRAPEGSAAATIGSASSVTSESLKVHTFKIYPSEESEVDRLITRALVLGDFESAVSLCLSADRFADAILLSVRGGPELLQRTQATYFERRTTALPYLRLFQSIVSDDLTDVVQNADLTEWQEIFVVLCTFAKSTEFNNLTEQLGQRLEHQYRVAAASNAEQGISRSKVFRKNATLCYLAAGKLEKVVTIWADEMKEEEDAATEGQGVAQRYSAHAQALQSFIEKVTIFQSATNYVDKDLASPTQSQVVADTGARTYRLANLYERYFEYADLLATQGLVDLAATYIKMTPADFQTHGESNLEVVRERYLSPKSLLSKTKTAAAPSSHYISSGYPVPPSSGPYAQTPVSVPAPPAPIVTPSLQPQYGNYGPAPTYNQTQSYTPTPFTPAPTANNYTSSSYTPSPYSNGGGYAAPPAPQYGQTAPPPPPPMAGSRASTPPIPAAQRRDIPGWNDPPAAKIPAAAPRPPSAAGRQAAFTSPFPNSTPPLPSPAQGGPQSGFFPPPPPRGNTPLQQGPPPRKAALQSSPGPPSRAGPPPGRVGPPVAPPPSGPRRAMSPLASSVSPPSFAAAPPNSSFSPPPPPSASQGMYAPPPNARGPPHPVAVAQPPPPPPQPDLPPRHPAGDRSHIPIEDLPVFEQIQFLFEYVKTLPPANPQIAAELSKVPAKLELLYDRLNNAEVSVELLVQLRTLAKSMENRQLQEAYAHLLATITNTNLDGLLPVMTAIKLLISITMSQL